MIYVDNASTTKPSEAVIEAMVSCMRDTWGNPSSVHRFGQRAADQLQTARTLIARRIGARSSEIYFTSGGSEADNQAIISAAVNGAARGKKHIISTRIEHHAVLHTLKKLEKQGFEVELIDVSENGIVSPVQLGNSIRNDTCLVTVMYANNEIGSIQPIAEIGRICKEKGVLFHTDAVQAVGHLPIDVNSQNIDMLSCSAHKFHGPKGIGFLYARKGVKITNVIEGGGQEYGKRGGTENLPAIVGMAVALEESRVHMKENTVKTVKLRDKLINGLLGIPGCVLNGDAEKRSPGNVNVSFSGVEGESLLLLLNEKGICASTGSACTSGSVEPSHVLMAIGRSVAMAHSSIRFSLCEENTEEEIKYIVESVADAVSFLRSER